MLPAANSGQRIPLGEHLGEKVVLIFLPSSFDSQFIDQPAEFSGDSSLDEQDAVVVGISDAEEKTLKTMSQPPQKLSGSESF